MSEQCGCRIEYQDEHYTDPDTGRIVYCPTRAAAPAMLEALRLAAPWIEGERRKHRAANEENEAAYMGEISDKLRAALALVNQGRGK